MSRRGIASSIRFISQARSHVAPRSQAALRFALAVPAVSITSTRPFSTSRTLLDNMRCVLIKDGKGPVENLYLGEEPTPSPKKGEVLVKVKGMKEHH